MGESNDPVDGDKDERQQGVVHKGKPKCWKPIKEVKLDLTLIHLKEIPLTSLQVFLPFVFDIRSGFFRIRIKENPVLGYVH